MIRRLVLAVLALALLAPLASAQTLDEILAKHFKAMGGMEKLRALQGVRMSGTMTMGPGMDIPYVLMKSRPNRMRTEFTFQGLTGIQAYDGKGAWRQMPFQGKKDPETVPAEQLKDFEQEADFDGPLVDWKQKGNVVELLGKDDVEGTPVYKLKITLKSGDVNTEFIDAESFLTIGGEGKMTRQGTEVESETSVGDYKEVEGLMFPFAIEEGRKGSPQKQKITVTKIELNPKLADSLFVMPAVAAMPDSTAAKPAAAAASTASGSTAKPAAKTDPKASASKKPTGKP